MLAKVDTQYSVDHSPIPPPHLFNTSSASSNLVHRIYAHARPRIPSSLNSGAWKTGPNLPHRLFRQRDARGSPFSSLLSKSVYLLSSPQRTRDVHFMARPPPRSVRAAFPHTAPASGV